MVLSRAARVCGVVGRVRDWETATVREGMLDRDKMGNEVMYGGGLGECIVMG